MADVNRLFLGFESFLDSSGLEQGLRALERGIGSLESRLNRSGAGANRNLRSMGVQAQTAAREVTAMGKTAMGVGSAVLGVVGKWVDEAGEFEGEMTKLSVVTNKVGKELKTFEDLAIQTGIETAFSPQEAVSAMTGLKQAGLDNLEVMKAMPKVLDLVAASSGEIDLDMGATVASVAMNKFGIVAKDVGNFMDELTRTTQISNLRFTDAERLMRSMGGVAASLSGTPRTSFLALAGAGRNMGLTARLTGKAIQAVGRSLDKIQRHAAAGKGIKFEAMKKLGITIEDLQDEAGNWIDLLDIIAVVQKKAFSSGLTEAERNAAITDMFAQNAKNLIVGVGKLKGIDPLGTGEVKSGLDALLEMRKALLDEKSVLGLSGKAAEKFLSTWKGLKKLFEGTIATFAILFGQTILPGLKLLLTWVKDAANVFLRWVQSSALLRGVLVGLTVVVGLLITAMGAVLLVFGTLASAALMLVSVWGSVALATTVIPALLVAVKAALAGLGIVFIKVVAVAVALYAVWKLLVVAWENDFAGLRTLAQKMAVGIASAWRVLVGTLTGNPIDEKDLINLEGTTVLTIIRTIGKLWYRLKEMGKGIASQLLPAWESFKAVLGVFSDALGEIVQMFVDFYSLNIDRNPPMGSPSLWQALGVALGFIWRLAVRIVEAFLWMAAVVIKGIAVIGRGFTAFIGFLWDIGSALFDVGDGWMDRVWEGMKKGWGRIVEWFSRELQRLNPFAEEQVQQDSGAKKTKLAGPSRGQQFAEQGFVREEDGSLTFPVMDLSPSPARPTAANTRAQGAAPVINVAAMTFKAEKLNSEEADRFAKQFSNQLGMELQKAQAASYSG